MAPRRPRSKISSPRGPAPSNQVRSTFRNYPHRTMKKIERFWREYNRTKSHDDTLSESQRGRFWTKYLQRTSPRRSQSLPPDHRCLTADAKVSVLQSIRSRIRRFGRTMRRVVGNRVSKIVNTAYNAAIFAAILIGATLYTGNMFHTNYKRALAQASIPSAPLERFRHFPTWMHTDPVQVLGFPAAVAPNLVPTKKDINRKEKQFRSKWSIDKWPRNHFTSQKEAELAFTRGIDAYNILMKWYENPHCEADTAPFRLRHQRKPRFVYNDSLPSLANPCRCTYPAYVVKQLKQIFVPVRLQPKVPQTVEGLSSYCPCTKADATASWATFEKDVRPAHLARIIKAMPWFPMDYRVLWYTISGFNTPQYIPWDDFNSSEYEKCFVKNDLPGKEAICDWAVEGDIFPVKTDCENSSWKNQQKKLDEELESLRWSLSQGMHGMGWD